MTESTQGARVDLTWAPTAHFRRLATVAAATLLAAVVLGRPALVVLAAPVVAALALAGRRPRGGGWVRVRLSDDHCFEREELTVDVRISPGAAGAAAGAWLALPPALAIVGEPGIRELGNGAVEIRWRVTAGRWGRWDTGQVVVTVRGRGGLHQGSALAGLGEITIYPSPPALTQLALPAELRTRIGEHVDRHAGDGAEFAGIRPFVAGDRPRRVNWPVSTRRGALHVNQLAAQRAAEIVVLIDALSDIGPAGGSSLEYAVRGAAGVARAYTRAGDRVGLITLYGPLRWIAPGSSHRQFFRVVESVLDARRLWSFISPDVSLIPRAVLAPGALVVFFSPLVDPRAVTIASDLRERGYPVIVVDVLTTEPAVLPASDVSELAVRVWRLEREAMAHRLGSMGVPVVRWPGDQLGSGAQPGSGDQRGSGDQPGSGQPGLAPVPVAAEDDLDVVMAPYARHRVRGGVR